MVQAASRHRIVNTTKYPKVLVSDQGDVLILRGWRYPALFLSASRAREWVEKRYLSHTMEIHGVLANLVVASMAAAGSKLSLIKGPLEDPILGRREFLAFEAPNGMRVVVIDDDLLVLAHADRIKLLDVDMVVSPSYYRVLPRSKDVRLSVDEIVHAGVPTWTQRQEPKPDVSDRRLLALYEEALRS